MRRHVGVRFLAFVAALAIAFSQPASQAQAQDTVARGDVGAAQHSLVLAVTGTTSTGGTFQGTLSVQHFASGNAHGSSARAGGTITGTVFDAAGVPIGTISEKVKVPVTVSQAGTAGSIGAVVAQQETCGVLRLEFGGIDLNVLGLVVTTGPITLDLSGETGGTNLLGTLVCQVLAALTSVANLIGLLNQLLGALGGLGGTPTA
jgi:hypothetical protein